MTEETLRQLLARVHERLSASEAVDPETRAMLATVMSDIDGALGRGRSTGAGTVSAAGALPAAASPVTNPAAAGSVAAVPVSPDARVAANAPRLEALAVRFEAEHPAMAQLLRQIGALLGQAGI
jgi:hypothetical protein